MCCLGGSLVTEFGYLCLPEVPMRPIKEVLLMALYKAYLHTGMGLLGWVRRKD
jgi:hypothetical protein